MQLADAQVLIIDDNAQIRMLLTKILSGVCGRIGESSDAIDGLAQWLALRPQLVFVDYEMPELSGATFTKILRSQEAVLGGRTAVFMITGHADRDHVMAAVQAGADGFIVKPLAAADILERAAEALAKDEREVVYV
jgi:CheY-like chemotaxis protein